MFSKETRKTIKNDLLLIAMAAGVAGYFVADALPLDTQARHAMVRVVTGVLPYLLFAMLFLEFSKINPRDLLPKRWIWMSFAWQLGVSALMIVLLRSGRTAQWMQPLWMGFLVCMLTPTASAVAVMTSKLGGNGASATTCAVLSSLFAALTIPLLLPLVSPGGESISFGALFVKIFGKVFPVIIVPLLISMLMRRFTPVWHCKVEAFAKDKSFYLWALCVAINMAQITRLLCMGLVSLRVTLLYAAFTLVLCIANFSLGKRFGDSCGDRISAGQGVGQKNTVLAIWVAMSFMLPESGIILGAYMIWQNTFNSLQLIFPRLR